MLRQSLKFDPKLIEDATGLKYVGPFFSHGALVIGEPTYQEKEEDLGQLSRQGFVVAALLGPWHTFTRGDDYGVYEVISCSEVFLNFTATPIDCIGNIIVEGARAAILDTKAQSDPLLIDEMTYGAAPVLYPYGFMSMCGEGNDGVYPVWVRRTAEGSADFIRLKFD